MDMGIWVSPCLQGMFFFFCSFVPLGIFLVSYFRFFTSTFGVARHVRATAISARSTRHHSQTVSATPRAPRPRWPDAGATLHSLLSFDIFYNIFSFHSMSYDSSSFSWKRSPSSPSLGRQYSQTERSVGRTTPASGGSATEGGAMTRCTPIAAVSPTERDMAESPPRAPKPTSEEERVLAGRLSA